MMMNLIVVAALPCLAYHTTDRNDKPADSEVLVVTEGGEAVVFSGVPDTAAGWEGVVLGEASGLVGSEETLGSCFPICPNKSDEGEKNNMSIGGRL